VSTLPYTQIIVTGCSLSTGMEMNDHLLATFSNEREREARILTWLKNKKIDFKLNSFEDLKKTAELEWHKKERDNSWPSLLQSITGIPVINLARIGSCIGYSLIEYSNFLKKKPNDRTLVIHQLPEMGRMYIRFDSVHGRVDASPMTLATKNNFGFNKSYFAKEIKNVHEVYRNRVMSEGYIEKHFLNVLGRLQNLSLKAGVDNFYIFPSSDIQPEFIQDRVLLKDFKKFRSEYPKGQFGHPVGSAFNKDLCNKITSTCL
jgi:hypothetical protein